MQGSRRGQGGRRRRPQHGELCDELVMSKMSPASSASYASSLVTSCTISKIMRSDTAVRADRSHAKLVSWTWQAALGTPKEQSKT